MPPKDKAHEQDKVSAARHAPRQKVQTPNANRRPPNPVHALRRAVSAPPSALGSADILALQRAVGNRAVGRILGAQPRSASPHSSAHAQAIQRKHEDEEAPRAESRAVQRNENRTGLPDRLKAGIEDLSGVSLEDVKVHYNSPRPAELQALAYTQGTDIHVAPGEDEHLPHEAWHVVQQKQGRVKPTLQAKGVEINDDAELEREADVMGKKAGSAGNVQGKTAAVTRAAGGVESRLASSPILNTVQRLDANSVDYFMPVDPFSAEFKADHIVGAVGDLTDAVAEQRRAAKQKAANTIVLMTQDEGAAELKDALKALVPAQDENFVGTTYEWTTKHQYQWRTVVQNAAPSNGNSKHKFGMKVEEHKIADKPKKGGAPQAVSKIKIKHYAGTA